MNIKIDGHDLPVLAEVRRKEGNGEGKEWGRKGK
jgi:hypothetical protein